MVSFSSDRADVHDLLHFHGFGVDLVVLGVRADELDVDDAEPVCDGNDQPVVIALDIEYDAPVLQHTGVPVLHKIRIIFRRITSCLKANVAAGCTSLQAKTITKLLGRNILTVRSICTYNVL